MRQYLLAGLSAFALAACGSGSETDTAAPVTVPAAPASPVPSANPLRDAYFGDVHVHTKNSFDAYIFNVRSTPDDAYRFAKGEVIRHDGGFDVQLDGPPLDFLAVTDHGEYLGILPALNDPDNPLSQTETGQAIFGENRANAVTAFLGVGRSFVVGEPIAEINDQAQMNRVWGETIAAAERHNAPGTFTTFAGYEFTAMRQLETDALAAANLHRNVIFRDDAPDQLFTTLNSINPEDLWDWMDEERAAGRDALAIPHNSNASNGEMFARQTYTGEPMTADYARQRLENEPLVEISQVKGTSDAHPMFSPNDEWADFEPYDLFIGSSVPVTVNEGDFVRQAYAIGLAIEDQTGTNPYAFGLIGSSDTHVAAGSFNEGAHTGKFPDDGTAASRGSVLPEGTTDWSAAGANTGRQFNAAKYSASGLAGVWAEANTRDALFEAMRRRETFGTSGPRLKVRFFAGAGLTPDLLDAPDLVAQAYQTGVPMGGDLARVETSEGPGFIAWAIRDPQSAPLQRLQVIKVWATADGATQETVHDVACAQGASPDPDTYRCPDDPVSVDPATCEVPEGIGAAELKAFWRDPAFESGMDAAYYVRALEVPTCRWSTWDAIRAGSPPNPNLPLTLQERVWSSPIWHDGAPD